MSKSTCRSCRAQIIWAHRPTGRIPLDVEPVEDDAPSLHTYVLVRDELAVERAEAIGQPPPPWHALAFAPLLHRGRRRFRSHFVTCPSRHMHSRAQKGKADK